MGILAIAHQNKRGLDLPISGAPRQEISLGAEVKSVALLAADYIGMRPKFRVKEGEQVKRGQILFEDRKNPGVVFTAPGSGMVHIHRGKRRALQSVLIALADDSVDSQVAFQNFRAQDTTQWSAQQVRALLIESGLWTALRARPFGKVAAPDRPPQAIFVQAMESEPLGPEVQVILQGREQEFSAGLTALVQLAAGKKVHLCRRAENPLAGEDQPGVAVHEFSGPHPAGTAGYHIHCIDPAGRDRIQWQLGYQDVVAIGALFMTGHLLLERVVALGGPAISAPRLLRTRLGANLTELTQGQLKAGETRIVSGSVLSGRIAMGPACAYLGRYHHQVSALIEERARRFLGWLRPGFSKFSVTRLFGSALRPGKKWDLGTGTHGGRRTLFPHSAYQKVMAFDLLAPFLLRALMARDLETAEALGCLELCEEDLALWSLVCPTKNDFGPVLREVLTAIEKEG